MRVPIVGIGLPRPHGRRASSLHLRFPLFLGLCLFGVGLIGSQAGERIRFPWIPGVGPDDMASTLLVLGVFALGSIALAAFRSKLARSPFLVWSLLAAGLIVCAFARPSFRFDGADHFLYSSIALVTSLLGVLGSGNTSAAPEGLCQAQQSPAKTKRPQRKLPGRTIEKLSTRAVHSWPLSTELFPRPAGVSLLYSPPDGSP